MNGPPRAFSTWSSKRIARDAARLRTKLSNDSGRRRWRGSHGTWKRRAPDPALAALGIFAGPTFELGRPQFDVAAQAVDTDIALAGFETGEPVDLSALTPATGETFA